MYKYGEYTDEKEERSFNPCPLKALPDHVVLTCHMDHTCPPGLQLHVTFYNFELGTQHEQVRRTRGAGILQQKF